jgi:hypothetical protein
LTKSPPELTGVAVVYQTVGRLGIICHRIEANAEASRFAATRAREFCGDGHGANAAGPMWNRQSAAGALPSLSSSEKQ